MGLLPFSIVLPVLVSIFAKSITKRASAFYRGMIFVPMILAPVAAAAVFQMCIRDRYNIVTVSRKVFPIQ